MSPSRLILVVLLALLAAFLLVPTSSAQITGGTDIQATPTPGVGHDYIKSLSETVQPENGQLSIRIDVPTRGGRGGIPYAYFYNSAGVHHVIPSASVGGRGEWATDISDTQGSGWSDTYPRITAIKAVVSSNEPGPPPYTASCVYFTNYVFQDSSGARHPLALQTAQSNDGVSPNHCGQVAGGGPTNSLTAGDPDGLYVANTTAPTVDTVPTNPPAVTLIGSDGTFYGCGGMGQIGFGPTAFFESGCSTGTDRNGNGLFPQPSISVTTTSETVPWQAFPFNYIATGVPAQQAYCVKVGPVSPGQMNVYQSINFPNNKSYTFSYDSVYGLMNQITYPTGGYVKYTWALNPISQSLQTPDVSGNYVCFFGYDTPVITNRYVSFDGVNIALEQDFCYATDWGNGTTSCGPASGSAPEVWTSKRTIVTTKDCARNNFNCTGAPSFTTTYNYQGGAETSIVYGDFSGNTLLTETKGWSGQALLCDLKTLNNGLISGVFYTYGPDAYGIHTLAQITDQKEYDYGLVTSTAACPPAGASAPSGITPTRDTVTSYASFAPSPYFPSTPSILDRPSSAITYSGSGTSGTRVAETDYGYDETAVSAASPAPWNHDNSTYNTSYNNRGNLTSVTKQCFNGPCLGGNSKTTYTYDETGEALTIKDACGNASCGDMTGSNHTTTYSYADSYTILSTGQNANYTPTCTPSPCNTNAFATKITDPLGHISSYSYDYNNGQLTISTDPNSQTTKYLYNDPFARPRLANYPDSGQTAIVYNDASYNPSTLSPSVTTTKAITSTTNLTTLTAFDGLGHTIQSKITSDPDCASGDRTDTTYYGSGKVFTVSNPYCTTSDSTYGLTTFAYDALGRAIQVTNPDGSTVLTTYTGSATQAQDEGNGNGTQRVTRISQSDALGRLKSVCEVSSATLVGENPTPASCGLLVPGTGFLTTYGYDPLNNLTQVSQGTMSPRTFVYDSLSRLTSATNPESGTITYTYDANGNLATKTGPKQNQINATTTVTTTYQYDALNRLLSKSYSDGTTPTASFFYDSSSWSNLTNAIGRLVESSAGPGIRTYTEYDPMGRVSFQYHYTPLGGQNGYSMPYTYDLLGNMTSASDGFFHTYFYAYSTASRLTGLTSSFSNSQSPATLLTASHYNAAGQVTSDTLGTNEIESYSYSHRNQLQSVTTKLNATTIYSYSLTFAPNGDVAAANDSVNGNWNYGYDAFNRLTCSNLVSNGTCASPTSGIPTYSYVYDRFGNRWQQNGPHSMQATFTGNNPGAPANNNRLDGFSYDAAGNLLNDGVHQYRYDAENRLISVDSTVTYAYNADGQRVHRTGYTTDTCDTTGQRDYVYDLSGHWNLEVNSNGTECKTEIYAGSRHFVTNGGGTYFDHSDWLGTVRLRNSYQSPTYFETCTSLPFGDGQTCVGGEKSTIHFTGKERDSESGLDNFGARYNSSAMGRFMSPDPNNDSGFENQDDPQSWNAYSYVRNNPLNLTDPDGRDYRVCVDNGNGGQNCTTYDKFEDFQKAANASNVTLNGNDKNGQILVNGKSVGTYSFFPDPGTAPEDNILAPTLFGGLFGGLKAGVRGLAEGLFGGGAKAAVEEGTVAAVTDAAAGTAGGGLTPGTVFNAGKGLLGGEAELSAHAATQAAARGVTKAEIEDALSMVPKQEAGRGSVFRFIGKAAEVRVNRVTGTIVTVIRFTGPGAASPLP
jgi:RHS repeat-associated protein